MAAFVLPPIIAKLRREQPGIDIDLVASNSALDLRRREADIAIRHFRPTEPGLVAKKVAQTSAWLYGAPTYLEALGHPATAKDMSRADFVGVDHGDALLEGLNALGLELTRDNFPIVSESHLVAWELVKQGLVVGLMQEDIGDAEPAVCRALPGLEPILIPIWLTTHREVKTSRRVRVVFDLLATELARSPRGSS